MEGIQKGSLSVLVKFAIKTRVMLESVKNTTRYIKHNNTISEVSNQLYYDIWCTMLCSRYIKSFLVRDIIYINYI